MEKRVISIISKLVILALVFYAGFVIGTDRAEKRISEERILQEGEVSLSLDFGDGRVEEFPSIGISGDENVFDVLLLSGAEVEYQDFGGDMGIFIETIEGVGQRPEDKGKWWQFWVNGEYAQVGASSHKINPGDEIMFRFSDEMNEN